MKKSFLLSITWITLVALTATTLYAQTTTGNSVISRMKAAVSTFTLTGDLNPGQTGLQSAPVSGKKTGDILTAGEWNRVLELLGEGGGSGSGSGWENVPLTGTENFDDSCMYRFQITYTSGGREPYVPKETYYYVNGVSPTQLAWWLENDSVNSTFHIAASSKNLLRINGTPYTTGGVSVTKIEKLCGGGGSGGGSGWVDVPLTDTADFDKACEYRYQALNQPDDPYMGNDPFKYINAVDNNRLTWISLGDYHHINSDSKTVYRINGAPIAAITINKLQKRCGGGSSGGGSIRPSSIDSSDRWPATFLTAFNQCKSEGKYLPTAEEALYFVFGWAGTYQNPSSNPLWTITPDDGRNAFVTVYSNSNVGLNWSGGMDRTGVDTPYSATATAHYRCVTGGGSGSSSGWSDIVLQGATPFNVNCEYRFKASAPGNTNDDAFIGDDNAYNYIQRVHANRLTYQHIGTSYEHINADTKTTLRQNGTPTSPAQTITQIQQRCN